MTSFVIVSATRLSENDFFDKSALGSSLRHSYGNYPLKLELFSNNSKGLGECYNAAIDRASDDDILIFVHDDVFLIDFFWRETLMQGFSLYDLLGVAGNTHRAPRQPAWAFINDTFQWDIPDHLSGVVGHGQGFPCQLSTFGHPFKKCKLLDGLFLAARKKTFKDNGIRFDEAFKFHFYDMDICRQFESKGLSAGTISLALIHESGGAFGTPTWRENYEKYLAKWGE